MNDSDRHSARPWLEGLSVPNDSTAVSSYAVDPTKQSVVTPVYEISGRRFFLIHAPNIVHLRRPEWSLEAKGATLLDAKQDVVKQVRKIGKSLLAKPHTEIAEWEHDLLRFLEELNRS